VPDVSTIKKSKLNGSNLNFLKEGRLIIFVYVWIQSYNRELNNKNKNSFFYFEKTL
jgi:hypothetical protein